MAKTTVSLIDALSTVDLALKAVAGPLNKTQGDIARGILTKSLKDLSALIGAEPAGRDE